MEVELSQTVHNKNFVFHIRIIFKRKFIVWKLVYRVVCAQICISTLMDAKSLEISTNIFGILKCAIYKAARAFYDGNFAFTTEFLTIGESLKRAFEIEKSSVSFPWNPSRVSPR